MLYLAWLVNFCAACITLHNFFYEDDEDLVVLVTSQEDDLPPGLSLAEVPDGKGPMVSSARQQ